MGSHGHAFDCQTTKNSHNQLVGNQKMYDRLLVLGQTWVSNLHFTDA